MNRIILLILSLALFACTSAQEEADEIMQDAGEYSAVSVTDPKFSPKPGDTFAWYGPLIWASEAVPHNPQMVQQITRLVNQELMEHGYKVIADQQQADYIIGAAIADGNSAQSEQVKQFFSLFPSLGNANTNLKETTALVGVIDSKDLVIAQSSFGSQVVLWRSSLATYVMGDKISAELQQQRLAVFAEKLMRSLP